MSFLALPSVAEPVTLPSGGQVDLHEILTESGDDAKVTRLRYVTIGYAPDAAGQDSTLRDATFLCQNRALPILSQPTDGQTIIISLADRAAPFGVMDASVAQIFEVFTVRNDTCIWEAF
ncbi:DUF6497 family protein [Roseovarius dicentrarchi]|uniref:DUF6497 family protein n=1 Tax=Roseovarius dicentrarchi TaxID=2250573 RepID=UPI000DEAAA7B|nr:DUF6497 family protein [Roseovarius dicentrarchi]